MTEATFKFCTSATVDVVSSVNGPQTGSMARFSGDCLHRSAKYCVVHVQCGFDASMYTTCM